MHAATDRLEFAPPPTPGLLRALGLAVLAHAFLLAALTWGVHWKREAVSVTVEAELWSALPQPAAPKLEQPPPAPPAVPPLPQVVPQVPDANIALEREKKRIKQEKLEAEQQQKEKLALEKKLAEEKKKKELQASVKEKLKAQEELKLAEKRHQENKQRMIDMAEATGAPDSTGTARQSSGPSAGYAGRIRARIKPNIVFTDDISGNPMAELEVRTAPDGTIISRKLTQPSGVKSWDDAVLKAIDKTEKLPRDVDGRVPPALIISFRPRD
nr:energy transducer TonB [Rhodoferax sp.]